MVWFFSKLFLLQKCVVISLKFKYLFSSHPVSRTVYELSMINKRVNSLKYHIFEIIDFNEVKFMFTIIFNNIKFERFLSDNKS